MEAISRHRANLSDFFESLGVMMVLRSFEPGNKPQENPIAYGSLLINLPILGI